MPLEAKLLNYPHFVELAENSLPNLEGIHLHKVETVDELESILVLNPKESKGVDVIANHSSLFLNNQFLFIFG